LIRRATGHPVSRAGGPELGAGCTGVKYLRDVNTTTS